MATRRGYTVVQVCATRVEAEALAAFLEAGGIEGALVDADDASGVLPSVQILGVRLLVPDEAAARAVEMLESEEIPNYPRLVDDDDE